MRSQKPVERQVVETIDELLSLRIQLNLQSCVISRMATIDAIKMQSIKLQALTSEYADNFEFVNITRSYLS